MRVGVAATQSIAGKFRTHAVTLHVGEALTKVAMSVKLRGAFICALTRISLVSPDNKNSPVDGTSDSQREVNMYNALGTVNVGVDSGGISCLWRRATRQGSSMRSPRFGSATRGPNSRPTAATWGTALTTRSTQDKCSR
jgi:hypothetical protein